MSLAMNHCKIVLQETIPKLVSFLKENNMDVDSFEIQIIGCRNYNAPHDEILEYCSFTSNENELTNFIHSLTPNIVLLMDDAPAQSKQEIQRKRKQHGEQHW